MKKQTPNRRTKFPDTNIFNLDHKYAEFRKRRAANRRAKKARKRNR